MVKLLIKLLARTIARDLERGSARRGIAGMICGLALGLTLAELMRRFEISGVYSVVGFIILGSGGGLLGAMIGASIGPDGERGAGPLSSPGGFVRVSDLNRALLPLAAFLILAAAGFLPLLFWKSIRKPIALMDVLPLAGIYLACLGFSALYACRMIWWIDVGPKVVVRRLLGSTAYPLAEIRQWGFEIARGRLVKEAPPGSVPFVVELPGGQRFETIISQMQAEQIARVLQRR